MNDLEWLKAKGEEQGRQQAEQLREARERAAREGKEPFDFAKLLTLYDPSSEMSSSSQLHDPQGEAERLEADYYLYFRDVKTLSEFADRLNELRSWS